MKQLLALTLLIFLTGCLQTKKQSSEGFYDTGPKRTQKLTMAGYTLNWAQKYDEQIEVTEPFELRAIFSTQKNLKNVNVSWVIPEGSEVLKGPTEETFTQLNSGESVNLSVTLQAKEDVNQKIILVIGSKDPQNPFAISKQINTHIPELNQ